MSLLLSVGHDCIGDISVVPENQPLEEVPPSLDLRSIGRMDFFDLFKKSLAGADTHSIENSIPGVQEKISAGMISFPTKSRRSKTTFILKLNPAEQPHLVENEMFFLGLAAKCGFETASAKIIKDSHNNSGLLIERFDRSVEKEEVIRLHVEDGCQFLNKYTSEKYRVSCGDIAEGIHRWATAPTVETGKYIKLLGFSYLIGNGDLHAKNISLMIKPNGLVTLSPVYDVLSTLPYGDQRMALKLDGRDDNIKGHHLISFGERYGVSKKIVLSLIEELVDCMNSEKLKVDQIGLSDKKSDFLLKKLQERLLHLKETK
jgi:serine/threonine-protein kinase HipA